MPSIWKRSRSRSAARSARAPRRALLRLLVVELDGQLAGLQLVDQLDCSLMRPPPRLARAAAPARSPASAPSSSSRRAGRRSREALASRRPSSQPADEPLDHGVELLRRHPPEERPPDRRVGAEAAAQEDVVGLGACPSSSRAVVPWKPMSPTQCWRTRAGSRRGGGRSRRRRRRSAPPGARSARPSCVLVSVTEKLQCGSPVQAIARAAEAVRRRAGSRSPPRRGDAPRRAAAVGTPARMKFCWRVMRMSPPNASARSATREHLVAVTRPR